MVIAAVALLISVPRLTNGGHDDKKLPDSPELPSADATVAQSDSRAALVHVVWPGLGLDDTAVLTGGVVGEPEVSGDGQAEVSDAEPANAAGAPAELRVTHYFCEGDSTGWYCGNMANGQVVYPGAAACHPSLMGRTVTVAGISVVCADTGGLVGWANLDIWCYSAVSWGWPGTPEGDMPCPVPSGWQAAAW